MLDPPFEIVLAGFGIAYRYEPSKHAAAFRWRLDFPLAGA
jgi:hypothetical protein